MQIPEGADPVDEPPDEQFDHSFDEQFDDWFDESDVDDETGDDDESDDDRYLESDDDDETESASPSGIRDLIDLPIALALIAVAAYARYRPLGPSSLWLDDSWAALGYKADGFSQLWRTAFTSPAFSLGTAYWLKAVGFSSTRAQVPAFVAGICGPAAAYLSARWMRLGTAAALLAGTAILVAPFHMQYSTHVKQYTFEALLSTVILVAGWRLLDAPTRRRWIGMTIAATLATLASIAVAPIAAGAFAAGFWSSIRRWTSVTTAIGCAAVYGAITGGWYLVVVKPESHAALRDYWRQLGGFWTEHGTLSDGTGLFVTFKHVAHGFSGLATIATILIMAAAIVTAFVRSRERALLLVVPFVVAIVLSGLQISPLGARVDVYLYPTFALLLAYAAQPLFERLKGAWVISVVVLGALLFTTVLPHTYQQENIRPLVDRLEAQASPNDPILLYPTGRFAFALYTHWPVRIHHDATAALPFTPVVEHRGLESTGSSPALRALVALYQVDPTVQRVWFIGSHGRAPSIAAMALLVERHGFTRTLTLGDAHAWLYEFRRTVPTPS